MERVILHSDLNNFYAAVECLYNPEIRQKPVAVCGDPNARHGIVLAKNQIAKKSGVKTGEAIWQAKQKCADLICVPPNFSLYLNYSKLAKEIYDKYTDQIEAFGIDECWLDVSGSTGLFGSGQTIANEIRHRIFKELGITASVGVSFNKIFAKLGSDMQKPDATTVITKENYKNIVWALPVSDLLYVGRSTTKKLRSLNINTIGDLANCNYKYLHSYLGKWGLILHRFANGADNSPVAKNHDESFVKSIGNSVTTPRDLITNEDVRLVLFMLSESVAARLRSHGLKCTTIQIYVRDKNLFSCERQASLEFPTFISSEIAEKAYEIFLTKYKMHHPIRSIGVRGTNLVPQDSTIQLNLFTDINKRDKQELLEHSIDAIRKRYGYHAIKKGILFTDPKIAKLNPKDDHVIHPLNFFK